MNNAALLYKPIDTVFHKTYAYHEHEARQSKASRTLNLSLVPANVERDAEQLHQWMNRPHVEEYWQQAWPINKITTYLDKQIQSYHGSSPL